MLEKHDVSSKMQNVLIKGDRTCSGLEFTSVCVGSCSVLARVRVMLEWLRGTLCMMSC